MDGIRTGGTVVADGSCVIGCSTTFRGNRNLDTFEFCYRYHSKATTATGYITTKGIARLMLPLLKAARSWGSNLFTNNLTVSMSGIVLQDIYWLILTGYLKATLIYLIIQESYHAPIAIEGNHKRRMALGERFFVVVNHLGKTIICIWQDDWRGGGA